MTCPSACPFETSKQSPRSFGVIDDAELLCRGARHNVAGNANTGTINPGLIDKAALSAGQFSVYRASGRTPWAIEDVCTHLASAPNETAVFKVLGLRAADLRAARSSKGHRFCALDETQCDRHGNHHHLHAHISPCRGVYTLPLDKQSDDFLELFHLLRTLFHQRSVVLSVV